MKFTAPTKATITRVAIVGIGVLLFLGQAVRQPASPSNWVSLIAPAFFLAAVWAATGALMRVERGDAFGPAMVRALNEIGACLILGAFAATVVQPSLIFLIGNGFSSMQGAEFDTSVENLTLALVGFVLLLLARQGRALQSKLDEFV